MSQNAKRWSFLGGVGSFWGLFCLFEKSGRAHAAGVEGDGLADLFGCELWRARSHETLDGDFF